MTTVTAPLAGRAIALASVPDPVFSAGMVGPGIAIDPERRPGVAVAPLDGVLVSVHPHAFVVVGGEGHGILTHLGLQTVQLNGEGFEVLVNKGDVVKRGQPLVRWDPGAVEAAGRSPICPVVALGPEPDSLGGLVDSGHVSQGDPVFRWG